MKPELKKELNNFLTWLIDKKDYYSWSKSKGIVTNILNDYEEYIKTVKLTHYVRFYYPGIMFSETSIQEIKENDDVQIPKSCFTYEFFDMDLTGTEINISGKHYIGDVYTIEDIEKMQDPSLDILLSNMKCNNFPKVVKTNIGNYQPLKEGDIVVPSQVYFRNQKLKRILNEKNSGENK